MLILSIIIPVYNVAKYLDACLFSIAQQRCTREIEVIIVNDGSTDGSGDIARAFQRKSDFLVKYHEQRNGGLSSARNLGLNLASGKYVMYLDSDDFFISPNLADLLMEIESRSLDLMVFSGQRWVYSTCDELVRIEEDPTYERADYCAGHLMIDDLLIKKLYRTGVYYQIAKRSCIDASCLRFIDGIIHEDHHYSFCMISSVGKCGTSDLKVYGYRVRQNSIMTSRSKFHKRFEGFSISLKEMSEFASKNEQLAGSRAVQRYLYDVFLTTLKYSIRSIAERPIWAWRVFAFLGKSIRAYAKFRFGVLTKEVQR